MTHNDAVSALLAFCGMALSLSFVLFVYAVFAV